MLIDFVPTVSRVSLAEAPGFLKAPGGAPPTSRSRSPGSAARPFSSGSSATTSSGTCWPGS
ncbi:unnamed protein product [Linum tenue]|uniref:Uncharacterized protein n=1 Tax=Linum tenue TaxID=586396 RepID=A0AAV0RY55_9ROSI|nr:unnamed protein product [Linum tenue]